jgi:SAM-dependent methyltransferase
MNDNEPEPNLNPETSTAKRENYTHNREYGTFEYWETRYANEQGQSFDWFKDIESLAEDTIALFPDAQHRILHLGCGNSTLGELLYKRGYHKIVNLDYSPSVIRDMSARCQDMNEMTWIVGDIFKMDDPQLNLGMFDIAIDKGTLDALLTKAYDQWNPPQDLVQEIQQYIKQVAKRIRPNGKFIHITFSPPWFRKVFLDIPEFQVSSRELKPKAGSFTYYCYELVRLE